MDNYIYEKANEIFKKEKLAGISLSTLDKKLDDLNDKYLKEFSEYDWVRISVVIKELIKKSK